MTPMSFAQLHTVRSVAGTSSIANPRPDPSRSSTTRLSRKLHGMKNPRLTLLQSCLRVATAIGVACSVQVQKVAAEAQIHSEIPQINKQTKTDTQLHTSITQDTYILGPGDSVLVELLDVPEYSGIFTIGPDGTLYLPRLRSIFVEGFTVEDLRSFLTQKFNDFVRDPQVFVSPAAYRPIRTYIGGEVARPGYYYLSGSRNIGTMTETTETDEAKAVAPVIKGVAVNQSLRQPTVFDALRIAGGVTPFSKLDEVSVTRNRPQSSGGGKMRTTLNFLTLITEGNESQNIRLFDGDTVVVGRSPVELREQIIKASQTNLSPDFVEVFVTGRVRDPGAKVLPQGATLDQALASAGGQKILRGLVEFIRFNRDGSTDKRKFFVGTDNPAGSYKNPILMAGDVVRVNESPLSATVTVLNEITGPALGIYSVFSIFD